MESEKSSDERQELTFFSQSPTYNGKRRRVAQDSRAWKTGEPNSLRSTATFGQNPFIRAKSDDVYDHEDQENGRGSSEGTVRCLTAKNAAATDGICVDCENDLDFQQE